MLTCREDSGSGEAEGPTNIQVRGKRARFGTGGAGGGSRGAVELGRGRSVARQEGREWRESMRGRIREYRAVAITKAQGKRVKRGLVQHKTD